ncbi:kinase-like domain-containing protein [Mycena vulgaris]|nr:kinase-like domain-containing protein [Mycena vulgaris]
MSPAFNSLPDHTGAFVDEGYLQLVELLGSGGYAKRRLDSPERVPHAPGRLGVVLFHHVFTGGDDGEFVFMVLDLAAGDMLHSIVKRHLYVDRPALVTEAFMEVLDAVEQCHENGVFQRDLKPQNFLCDAVETRDPPRRFGMVKREDESQIFKCGTLAFRSPECADSTPPNRVFYSPRESDLWALAVVLFTPLPWSVANLSDPKYAAFRADEERFPLGALLLELVHSRAPQWPPCALCRASSAGLSTPSLFIGSAPPSTAIGDLLDAANVGLAMLLPPFVPTKLHTHSSSSNSSSIVLLLPPPVDMAPEYRFLGHKKRNIATRQRFADKLCRVY